MRGNPVGNAADIVVVADIEQARLNVGPCSTREARGFLKRTLIDVPESSNTPPDARFKHCEVGLREKNRPLSEAASTGLSSTVSPHR